MCLGKDKTKLKSSFEGIMEDIIECETMSEAVRKAYQFGEDGDIVLLSPACASFDLFENFEERGRQFKEQVREL